MGMYNKAMRCLVAVLFALTAAGAGLAQDDGGELVRYLFTPPLDTDVVQSIEAVTYLRVDDSEQVIRWSHDLIIRLEEREPPDLFRGTFELRNVVNQQNAERDLYYLIAKAIEGQTYPLGIADFGVAFDTDWPSIQQKILERLPVLADPPTASTLREALPLFADGAVATMRASNTLAAAYILGFRRDGEVHSRTDVGALTFFGIEDAIVHTTGGLGEKDGDLVINWLVTPDPEAAAAKLGAELRALTRMVDAQMGTDSREIVETALMEGLDVGEEGQAIYDLEPGLMREVTFHAWIATETLERIVRYKLTRLSP